jgi:glycosyltransferase involved in cell wall biosynthesis
MRVVVTVDHRFERTPDQRIWTQTGYAYPFWQRYLAIFDAVHVVARVRDVSEPHPTWQYADGVGVQFTAIPYFIGPQQYLLQAHRVRQVARRVVQPSDAVILRGGAGFVTTIEQQLWQVRHPFAVEVIGDPYDVFAPGANSHPLRPFFRWYLTRALQQRCHRASAALYVTQSALQARYPCPHWAMGVSDVELPDEAITLRARTWSDADLHRPMHLVFVGTLETLYKAPDILIEAVAMARQSGLHLKLTLVGAGRHQAALAAQAQRLGLTRDVLFRGQLTAGHAVQEVLDQADVFVLPSYQEGLPRAMLEAMARGLPCIGSSVGGVPELIPAADRVPPGNAIALMAKIQDVVTQPQRMTAMSARNLAKAEAFRNQVLQNQRRAFYSYVRELTERWVTKSHA